MAQEPQQLTMLLDRPVDRRKPREPIIREAGFAPELRFRFWLRRSWANGPRLGVLALNPSNASDKKDDPTTWRLMEFANRWGYGSMVICNLYPLITPHQQTLWVWRMFRMEGERQVENLTHTAQQFVQCDGFLAAWGAEPAGHKKTFRADLNVFLAGLTEALLVSGKTLEWQSLGVNQCGNPKHPMARGRNRVPDDALAMPYIVYLP